MRGFTLVELIIYITLTVLIGTAILSFSIQVVETSQKSRSFQEVQQNARVAMQRMIQEIKSASDLNTGSSAFDVHPGVLSLEHQTGGLDPTVFDISSGTLRITQGANGPYDLTSSNVRVSNLVFTNLSSSGRVKVIRIEMTVDHANPGSRNYLDARTTVQATAVLRVQEN